MLNLEDTITNSVREASKLTSDLWNDPDCQAEVKLLVGGLLDPEMLTMLAIHEAGHEIYFLRAGSEVLGFESPRILYKSAEAKPFAKQPARIKLGSKFVPQGADWFSKLLKAYAAGGRCSSKLSSLGLAGDSQDRTEFKKQYISCFEGSEVSEADIEKAWLQAQKDVDNDLESKELQNHIKLRGSEILPDLFPWLLNEPNIHP